MPRSRSRNRWPDCVPGGIRTFTGPSSTGSFDPGAERRLVHGHRQHARAGRCPRGGTPGRARRAPSTYRSPAGPPRGPASPLPASRTRSPSAMPGGQAHRHALGPHLVPGAARTPGTAAAAAGRCRRTRCSCARTPCGRARCAPRPAPGTVAQGAGAARATPAPRQVRQRLAPRHRRAHARSRRSSRRTRCARR